MTNLTAEERARGSEAGNRTQADRAVAENCDLLADLYRLRAHGATLRECAANLNDRGIKTRTGKAWSQVQIKRLLDRVHGRVEFVIQRQTSHGWADFKSGFETYNHAETAMNMLPRRRKYLIEVCLMAE
jgi:hypothetical protein